MARCGALRQVFDSKALGLPLKLSIYKSAVTSLLTYGSEAWQLDEKTCASINGASARCLSRFTGQSSHEEASAKKRTYDMVSAIRKRRHQWLGHILRLEDTSEGYRLVKLAARMQWELGQPGNICMDAPATATFEELVDFAKCRKTWAQHWDSIAPPENNATKKQLTDNNNPTTTATNNTSTTASTATTNTTTTTTSITTPTTTTNLAAPKPKKKRKSKKKKGKKPKPTP